MAFVGTVTSGLQLFASVMFAREHRAAVANFPSARSHVSSSAQSPSIHQELAGRTGGNGLAMRWLADDVSLRATWAGPTLAG